MLRFLKLVTDCPARTEPSEPRMPRPHSMRRAAWQAVRGFHDRGWRVNHSLDKIAEAAVLEPRDRAAAASLASICVRRRASLDAVLTAYVDRPRGEMENDLWMLAQLGAAQLFFRDDIPDHAAIHATSEVAKEIGADRWVGFLNGTLRRLAGAVERVGQPSDGEPAATDGDSERIDPATRVIATDALDGWLRFDRVIANEKAPGKQEAKLYSLPRWLVRRWMDRLPDPAAVMRASNVDAGMWLRCATAEDRDPVLAGLTAAGHQAEAGELPESIYLPRSIPLMSFTPFVTGRCSVQDLTAMRAVDLLDPRPGESVLDLCAAPGGKTTMIVQRMQNRGSVLAADSDQKRLPRIKENMKRIDARICEIRHVTREGEGVPDDGSRDAAIVDVPCSNTGVLSKRPEARWRVDTRDLEQLPPIQSALLARAAAAVKSGGRVLYSTCSIEPDENEQVVAAFLEQSPGWTRAEEQLTLPDGRVDGGYRALLRRG